MARMRVLSIALLLVTSCIGLVRGCRMIAFGEENGIVFPYRDEMLRASVFSNYRIIGWVVLLLIGLFGLFVSTATIRHKRNYGYFIIMESIFCFFLTMTHILLSHFVWVHLVVLVLCLALLVLGILQTPREF